MSIQKYSYLYTHFLKGKEDGAVWATTATQQDFDEQENRQTLNECLKNGMDSSSELFDQSPLLPCGSAMGIYFDSKFVSSADYGYERFTDENDGTFLIPNEAFRAYQDGWVQAVYEYKKIHGYYLSK